MEIMSFIIGFIYLLVSGSLVMYAENNNLKGFELSLGLFNLIVGSFAFGNLIMGFLK